MNAPDAASPCRKICLLDPKAEACIGCGRTRAEIAGWLAMSLEERAATNVRAAARLAAAGGEGARDRR